MKKLNVVSLALAIVAFSANAQDDSSLDTRDRMHIGARAGLNYANVYDSKGEEFDADAKYGMAIGVFVSIPIGTYFGIQSEALYSQKGFQATGEISGLKYDFTRTASYLDIPIYFALKPSEFLTILLGPQYSYLLSRQDAFETGITTVAQEEQFENDNIRKNIIGASIAVDVNINHLVFGARVNWDLLENNSDGKSITPHYKNQWLQATIGFKL